MAAAEASPDGVSVVAAQEALVPPLHQARVAALDGVRGLAALGVLLYHLGLPLFLGAGQEAMEVFFVLSGFVITTSLLLDSRSAQRISPAKFYRRRVQRLLPALLLVVVATLGLSLVASLPDEAYLPQASLAALLYSMNWWEVAGGPSGLLDFSWSLAVEEQIYLVWPWIMVALLRLPARRRLAFLAMVLALLLAIRVGLALTDAPLVRIRNGTDTRGLGFVLGAGLALALDARPGLVGKLPRWTGMAAMAVLLVIPSVVTRYEPRTFVTWWLAAPLATTALVAGLVGPHAGRLGRWMGSPPLAKLGLVSYGLYVWHPIVIWTVQAVMGPTHLAGRSVLAARLPAFLVAGTLSLAAAWLSYRYVERRFWRPRVQGPAT